MTNKNYAKDGKTHLTLAGCPAKIVAEGYERIFETEEEELCKKLNIEIPKDLSIIGYDNIQLSSLIEPKLTTMDQNMYLLGTNAASLIKDKIDCNNEYSKRIILNNTLVERDTVKKI